MSHANAPLSPNGRLRLARCIVEDRWSLRLAADRYGVSVTTAQRWGAAVPRTRQRRDARPGRAGRTTRPVNWTGAPSGASSGCGSRGGGDPNGSLIGCG